jgi:hypothetical protein
MALAVILIIALLLSFVLLRGAGTKQVATAPTNTANGNTSPTAQQPATSNQPIPLAPVTIDQTVAQKNRNMTSFAMQFVDRYGSYSTDGNFQNLKDELTAMTDAMQSTVMATINKGTPAGVVFYGVTTKSLVVKVEASDAASATVLVSARRSEIKGTAAPRVFNQDMRLSLVKSGEEWLVASATWIPEAK